MNGFLDDHREPSPLMAVADAARLGFMILVWLLALVPAALLALAALAFDMVRRAVDGRPTHPRLD